jgi:hypothetical protein
MTFSFSDLKSIAEKPGCHDPLRPVEGQMLGRYKVLEVKLIPITDLMALYLSGQEIQEELLAAAHPIMKGFTWICKVEWVGNEDVMSFSA